MARTPRFGFSYFGQGVEGDFAQDGGKFTGSDRYLLDRILSVFEHHNHLGGFQLTDPGTPPELALDTTNGQLPAGRTFYYRIAYVDANGLETAAGEEASVATPDPVNVPDPPNLNAESGGMLEPGLWFYGLTAVRGDEETPLSVPALITVTDWRSVRVSLLDGLPEGADKVGIWRQGPTDAGFTRIAELTSGSFLDDGSIESDPCPCDPDKLPPEDNLTNATSQVTVTIANPVSATQAWRLYRAEASGAYDEFSLVAEIVRDGTTLPLSYDDDGSTPLLPGTPLEVSQALTPSVMLLTQDLPQALGTASAGTGSKAARADHVHPELSAVPEHDHPHEHPEYASADVSDGLQLNERTDEPPAPAEGGVLYVYDGELRFKGASDVVTIIGPA